MLFCRFLATLGMLLLVAGGQRTQRAVEATKEAENSSGSIALIDLDEVAKRLDRFDDLATKFTGQLAALNRQTSQLQQTAQAKFLEANHQAVDRPADSTEEVTQKIATRTNGVSGPSAIGAANWG